MPAADEGLRELLPGLPERGGRGAGQEPADGAGPDVRCEPYEGVRRGGQPLGLSGEHGRAGAGPVLFDEAGGAGLAPELTPPGPDLVELDTALEAKHGRTPTGTDRNRTGPGSELPKRSTSPKQGGSECVPRMKAWLSMQP